MITLKKKPAAKFPKAKITHAVQGLLKGKDFKLQVADSKIGKMKIVRVVTPAWKTLRPAVRIGRVRDAVNSELTAREQKGILRFSVLTPQEYQEVVLRKPAKGKAALAI
jgi:hypothetical protein